METARHKFLPTRKYDIKWFLLAPARKYYCNPKKKSRVGYNSSKSIPVDNLYQIFTFLFLLWHLNSSTEFWFMPYRHLENKYFSDTWVTRMRVLEHQQRGAISESRACLLHIIYRFICRRLPPAPLCYFLSPQVNMRNKEYPAHYWNDCWISLILLIIITLFVNIITYDLNQLQWRVPNYP